MSDQELTYLDAATEIDQILETIEAESEIDIDALAGKVERAAKLIAYCSERLKHAETRVLKIADELTVSEKPRESDASSTGASSAMGEGTPANGDSPIDDDELPF